MKHYVCKDSEGNINILQIRGKKPKEAIGLAPKDECGCFVTNPELISINGDKSITYNKSKADTIKKAQKEREEKEKAAARQLENAKEYLKTIDISKVKTMAETQEVLFNILRIMGIK